MKKINKYRTCFLLPKNDFFVGMGTVLNVAGDYFDYNYSENGHNADSKAIKSDWFNVGSDIKIALKKAEKLN